MDQEHKQIMEKLDEIMDYLKNRKPEVDEKLAKMLMCSCGPDAAKEDGCGCGCDCECCKSGKCHCESGCDCECCKSGKCKCGCCK